jgi:hypothetical protein
MSAAGDTVRPGPGTASVVVNFAAFQAGWFACVLSAAHGAPWMGTLTAAAIVAFHTGRAVRPLEELKLIGVALLMGIVCDSLLFSAGWLDFKSGVMVPGMAPHWILAMWALFATTLNVSLAWVKGRLVIGAVLGAVAGPLAYWGGARLNAVVLADPVPALVALAVVWALATPLLALAARRYDGISGAR